MNIDSPTVSFTDLFPFKPIYLTSTVPCEAAGEDVEEDGGVAEEQEGGEAGEADDAPLRFQTYKDAVKKFSLQHLDNDMVSFKEVEKLKCVLFL